jgi:hypothetical protein
VAPAAFLFLVLAPFFSFAAENIGGTLDVLALAWIAIAYLAVAVVAWAVLSLILRQQSPVRVANFIAVSSVAFFSFGLVVEVMTKLGFDRYYLRGWGAVFIVVAVTTWLLARGRNSSLVLAAVGFVMITASSVRLVIFVLEPGASGANILVTVRPVLETKRSPNVYFIVLDAYARDDVLSSDFQFDNGPFLSEMEARGFFVANQSMANFPQTLISLGSTLSMAYLLGEGSYSRKERRFPGILNGANNVVNRFKVHGYSYVLAPPGGWQGSACRGFEDACIKDEYQGLFNLTELQVSLMKITPVYNVLQPIARRIGWGEFITYTFLDLDLVIDRTAEIGASPFFLFAHIFAPHPPYQYEADCSSRATVGVKMEAFSTAERNLYLGSVKCLNSQIVPVVDRILANDPNPIIIIQSDHGSGFRSDWDSPLAEWSPDQIRERFGILSLTLLPRECQNMLYDSVSPVNTFRIVFSCIEGNEMALLPDVSYLARYGNEEVELIRE